MRKAKTAAQASTIGSTSDRGRMAKGEPAGDRTNGISRADAAKAAAQNVICSGITEVRLAAMARNFVDALHGDGPNRLSDRLDATKDRIWRDHFVAGAYWPERIRAWQSVNHGAYVAHLTSPSNNTHLIGTTAEMLLGTQPDIHARALDQLRDTSRRAQDTAYDTVMRGSLGLALQLLRDGKYPAHCQTELRRTIARHGRLFLIRTAHEKITVLRAHATAPYGDGFSGFRDWCLMGHSVLATIAAPATILARLAERERSGCYSTLSDASTVEALVSDGVLPPGEDGEIILNIAKVARDQLWSGRRSGTKRNLSDVLNFLARGTAPAAALNRGDMKADGLSRLDFATQRLGLSAAEGSTYVGIETLRAIRVVDLCVEAILKSQPLPINDEHEPGTKAIAFTSVILRAEGRPDKNAAEVGPLAGGRVRELDRIRGSGRMPLRTARARLSDPHVASRAKEALGIDATVWFRT